MTSSNNFSAELSNLISLWRKAKFLGLPTVYGLMVPLVVHLRKDERSSSFMFGDLTDIVNTRSSVI